MTTELRFGPPPASTLDLSPTGEDVERFRQNGFLAVERLTTDEELAWLTDVFHAVFEEVDGDGGEPGHPKARFQSMFPELKYPELLGTTFRRNARRYAAALLGVDEDQLSSWGHMIRKPVGNNRLAPWHQDEAYWESELRYQALGAWLPLHDVSVEMGAMQFIPGSHRWGVVNHRFHDGDPAHNLLAANGVDESAAVPCPLPAGGATFHHCRTLHYTAPNTTDRERLAYPIEFQVAPVRRARPAARPWVDEYRAATGRGPLTFYIADGEVVRNGLGHSSAS